MQRNAPGDAAVEAVSRGPGLVVYDEANVGYACDSRMASIEVDALGHAARVALWLMALDEAEAGHACGEVWHHAG